MTARDAARRELAEIRKEAEAFGREASRGVEADRNPSAFVPTDSAPTEWDLRRTHVFDIEASEWTTPVALGHLDPEGGYRAYTCEDGCDPVSEFLDEAFRAKWRNSRFVAHNGSGYDFGFIIDELISRDLEFSMLKNGQDRPIVIQAWDESGKPRFFQDSLVLLPRTLNTLAEAFVPELENIEEVDYEAITASWTGMAPEFRADMLDYLRNDCEVLHAVLQEFTEIIEELSDGRCGPQLTIGSTTLAVYRTNFFQGDAVTKIRPSFRPLNDTNPEEFVREAYTGGRTEVFRQHAAPEDGPFYHYDVNSLFPHCYTNFTLPVGNPSYQTSPNPDLVLSDDWDQYGGAVKVRGVVPDHVSIPVLPVRIRPEGAASSKTVFPKGEIEGWYMLREVRYAVRNGFLELDDDGVKEAVISRNENQFTEFGTSLFELKSSIDKHTNPGKYNVVKFLLNAFYGKFALDRQQSNVHRKDPSTLEGATDFRYVGSTRDVQSKLWDLGVVSEPEVALSTYILPRISAAITAQARIEMHEWFRVVEEELGGRVFYCDTDSIVTDVPLPDRYVTDELGMMDLEAVTREGYFLRPKTYAEVHDAERCSCGECEDGEGVEIKGKGMRDLEDHVTFEDYRAAYHDDDPGRIGVEWSGLRGLLSSLKHSRGEKSLDRTDFSRALGGFDDKRDHASDGKTSTPIPVAVDAEGEICLKE